MTAVLNVVFHPRPDDFYKQCIIVIHICRHQELDMYTWTFCGYVVRASDNHRIPVGHIGLVCIIMICLFVNKVKVKDYADATGQKNFYFLCTIKN